jgi:hypothetical protein
VRSLRGGIGEFGKVSVDWNLRGADGRRVPGGLYLVRAASDGSVATTTVVVR